MNGNNEIDIQLTEPELRKYFEYRKWAPFPAKLEYYKKNKITIKLSTFMKLFGNDFHDVKHWPHEIRVKKG
jgi:hypothetical protein